MNISGGAEKCIGGDLPILPGESTTSVKIRVGFTNAFAYRQLCKYFSWSAATKEIIHDPRGSNILGLQAPDDEVFVFNCLSFLKNFVFDRQFKFCSICFQRGYHSFWFQLIGLSHCPIHKHPLKKTCCSCSASTIAWSEAGKYKWYNCTACSSPLGGAEYRYGKYLKNRIESRVLERAFEVNWKQLDNFNYRHVASLCSVVQGCFVGFDLSKKITGLINRYSPLGGVIEGSAEIRVIGVAGYFSAIERKNESRNKEYGDISSDVSESVKIYKTVRKTILSRKGFSVDAKLISSFLVRLESGMWIDCLNFDSEVLALAYLDYYFDSSNESIVKPMGATDINAGFALLAEPCFASVRDNPKMWKCVILGMFGLLVELFDIIRRGGLGFQKLPNFGSRGWPRDGRGFVSRLMIRELANQVLPVMKIHDDPSFNFVEGYLSIVPNFYGLDYILRKLEIRELPSLLKTP